MEVVRSDAGFSEMKDLAPPDPMIFRMRLSERS